MTDEQLYEVAYNAHEETENAALVAMHAKLREQPIEALACLADPDWGWGQRGSLSGHIIDLASQVLDGKLEEALGRVPTEAIAHGA